MTHVLLLRPLTPVSTELETIIFIEFIACDGVSSHNCYPPTTRVQRAVTAIVIKGFHFVPRDTFSFISPAFLISKDFAAIIFVQ
ncbi:hypothetical protein EB796_014616 [Bugula neritina]|uniref:Uncharacterized protein n=1 Tax=Bugula neritina TaxID=10212 RepID=A0A7J7JL44_BUGNE|nr:hypothetical protein EB796_014616 [Bugula neritina]